MENDKKFWTRLVGGIILLGLGGFAAYLAMLALPFLLLGVTNGIILGAELLFVAAVIRLALDRRFRLFISTGYSVGIYNLTKRLVTIDPIAIMRLNIRKLNKYKENMDEQIEKLRGQMKILQRKIEGNSAAAQDDLNLAKAADKRSETGVKSVKLNNVARLEKSNQKLNNVYVTMEKLYRTLVKMSQTAALLIEDTTNDVNCKEDEYKSINAASSAFQSAMSIIKGNPDEKAIMDMANQELADNFGMKMGEIENFMEVSSSFLKGMDIQNGVMNDRGLEIFEAWEKKSDSLLLGNEKAILLSKAENPNDQLDLDAQPTPVPVTAGRTSGSNKYNNMLDK